MSTFIAYEVSIELVRELRHLVEIVGKHDSNLADQIKRAGTSVVLNLSEGARRVRGNQQRAYEIAHGEARELLGALDCAAAWGYVLDARSAREKLDRLLGLLWGLTHSGRAKSVSSSADRSRR
jgi:four helix bundle protein